MNLNQVSKWSVSAVPPSAVQANRWKSKDAHQMITPQEFVELHNFIVKNYKDQNSLTAGGPALQMPGLLGNFAQALDSIQEFRSRYGEVKQGKDDTIDRRINADVEEMKPFAASLLYILVQGAKGAASNIEYASLAGYDAIDKAMEGFPFVDMIKIIQKHFTNDHYKAVFAKDTGDNGLWFKKIVDKIVYRYTDVTSFTEGPEYYRNALALNALNANNIPTLGTQVVQTLAEKFVLPNNAEKYEVSPDEFHVLAKVIRGDKKSLSSKLGTVLASKKVFVDKYAEALRGWRDRGAPVRRSVKTWPEMEAFFDSPEYTGDITKKEFIQKYGVDPMQRNPMTPYVYSPKPHNNILFEYLSNVVLYGLAQGSIGVKYAETHKCPVSYTGYDYIHQAVQKVIPLGEILGLIADSFDDSDYKTVFGNHADSIKAIFNKLAALKIGRASGPIDLEDLHYMITHNYAGMGKN